jgi:hypothetical protein
MEFFQDNINERWETIRGGTIRQKVLCMPLYFHHLFDEISDINISNKILLPKHILRELSKYDDLMFPLTIRIQGQIVGVHDILPDIDAIYVPEYICNKISLNEPQKINIEIINIPYPKATFIKLKPYESKFYEIIDTRGFLEENLKKYYTHIEKGNILECRYNDTILHFDVVETQPENIIVSLNETNVEVDFERAHDWKPPVNKIKSQIDYNWNPRKWKFPRPDDPINILETPESFSSGEGRKLSN